MKAEQVTRNSPWRNCGRETSAVTEAVRDSTGMWIADCPPGYGTLLSSAPDLLEALKDLLETFRAYVDVDAVANGDIAHSVDAARAAIAKATQG